MDDGSCCPEIDYFSFFMWLLVLLLNEIHDLMNYIAN